MHPRAPLRCPAQTERCSVTRQHRYAASDAGKVHGCFRNGMTCSGPAATGAWSATTWWPPTRRATSGAIGTCAETPAGSVLAVIFDTRPVVPSLRKPCPTHWGDGLRLGYITRSGICFNIVTNASRCTPTGRATNIADTAVALAASGERNPTKILHPLCQKESAVTAALLPEFGAPAQSTSH